MVLTELLTIAKEKYASDLHISVGTHPTLRSRGELIRLEQYPKLTPSMTSELAMSILGKAQIETLERYGQVDFSFGLEGIGRFRCNVYRQRGSLSAAFRVIPIDIPRLETLGLPEAVDTLWRKQQGLILVTGPTGSGKSTTLAAMIDRINSELTRHIVTLEDPIEFLHRHNKSIVNQREIGADSESFALGLRAALRQDPDVILVGEMRDLETIATTITAAETGHLVFATLHTIDCVQAIDRIIDVFPPHQQQQIRVQLAGTLQAILAQQLIPRLDRKGQIVAAELMVMTPAIRNLIREGKTYQIYSAIQAGGKYGMQTIDKALTDLLRKGIISREEALARARDVEEVKRVAGLAY